MAECAKGDTEKMMDMLNNEQSLCEFAPRYEVVIPMRVFGTSFGNVKVKFDMGGYSCNELRIRANRLYDEYLKDSMHHPGISMRT